MHHYAYFRGYVCTARADGGITLDAKVVVEAAEGTSPGLLASMIVQANLANDLFYALEELVTRCDGKEGVRMDGSNIQTMRAHEVLERVRGELGE